MENEIKIFEDLSFIDRANLIKDKLSYNESIHIEVNNRLVPASLLNAYRDFLDVYNPILCRPILMVEHNEISYNDFRDRLVILINEIYYSLSSDIARVVTETYYGKIHHIKIYFNGSNNETTDSIIEKRYNLFKELTNRLGFVSHELEISIESFPFLIG